MTLRSVQGTSWPSLGSLLVAGGRHPGRSANRLSISTVPVHRPSMLQQSNNPNIPEQQPSWSQQVSKHGCPWTNQEVGKLCHTVPVLSGCTEQKSSCDSSLSLFHVKQKRIMTFPGSEDVNHIQFYVLVTYCIILLPYLLEQLSELRSQPAKPRKPPRHRADSRPLQKTSKKQAHSWNIAETWANISEWVWLLPLQELVHFGTCEKWRSNVAQGLKDAQSAQLCQQNT